MATEMHAAALTTIPSDRLDMASVPVPTPGADDDVVLQVEACGICGTDLHIMAGDSYRPEVPFVLGHEPVGVVVQTGAGAQEWLGRRATMTLFTGDGTCPSCLTGDERLCPNLKSITGVLDVPGGYAEYLRAHRQQLIDVPDNLTGPEIASLVDSGATAANSVRVAIGRDPERVLVLGAGPIGHLSAEILHTHGVTFEAVEPNPLRLAAMADLGHHVVPSVEDVTSSVDVVIDCTGSPAAFTSAIGSLGPRGLYVLAGYARVPDVDFGVVARKEADVRGIRSGRRDDLEFLIGLVANRRVRLPELALWRLTEINDALDAVRDGEVAGKAIIVPDSKWDD